MAISLLPPIISLLYCITIVVVFFSKKRLVTLENKIYSTILLINAVGLVFEILCSFAVINYESHQLISKTNFKCLLLYLKSGAIIKLIT